MKKYTVLLLICIPIITCHRDKNNFKHIDSSQINNSIITPSINFEIKKEKNIIFCSTFKIAWDSLKNKIFKENIMLEGQPDLADHLNNGVTGIKDLSKKYYIAMAGFVKDRIINKINTRLKQKFPDSGTIPDIETKDPTAIISFAYLYKDLQFDEEFEKIDDPIYFNNNKDKRIKCFGINKFNRDISKHKKILRQFEICDYIDNNDFIIKIISKNGSDQIVLAKIKPGKTLLDTVKDTYNRIKSSNKKKNYYLTKDSTVQIPVFNFKINHEYKQLLYKKIKNKGFREYFFAKALQNIFFKLDERGAGIKSYSFTLLEKSASQPAMQLIFDKPFLLYVKEKNAQYPYFVMWINNTELMVK